MATAIVDAMHDTRVHRLIFNAANPAVGEVLWEVSKDNGALWVNPFVGTSPGFYAATVSFPLTATDEMYQATAAGTSWRYRATLSGGLAGRQPLVTSVATITVNNDPTAATVQVAALNIVPEGEQTLLLALVAGNPSPTIGWQVSTDLGVNWTDLVSGVDGYSFATALQPGNNQAALYLQARADLDGYLYRPYVFNTTAPERRYGNPTTFRTQVSTTTSLSCSDQAYHVDTTILCVARVRPTPLYPPLRRSVGGGVLLTISDGASLLTNQTCTLVGGDCVFNGSVGYLPSPTTLTVEASYQLLPWEGITDQTSTSAPQTILVTDCVRPVITEVPSPEVLHTPAGTCSIALPDYAAQTTAAARDCAVTITQSPAPGTMLPVGTHSVVITAESAGGTTTQTVVVQVVDHDPPVFSFEGEAPLVLSCGSDFDLSATVTDGCDGQQTVYPQSGYFNRYENGVYTLEYRFGDQSGNVVTASRVVEVTGAPTPAVTLTGPAEMSIACGEPFSDPGATATGQCGAPLQVTVTGTVNSSIAGTYILTYSAQGPSGELTTTRAVTVNACRTETMTMVDSSSNPSVYGQPVTLIAMVRSSVGTPSGTIQLTYDGGVLPPQTLENGDASFEPALPMPVGPHTLDASYDGSDQHLSSSTPEPFRQLVIQADTETSLFASASPAVFGQSITITPTVAVVAPGGGSPTGTLSVSIDGGTPLVQADLTAGFSADGLAVGDHDISVTYSGDGNFNGSTKVLSLTINKGATETALASSVNPSAPGDAITFTAQVTVPSPAAGSPAGTVIFSDGATVLATIALDAGFQAQYTTTELAAGTHGITAEYSGDGSFLGSISTVVSQVVTNRAPTANGATLATSEDTPLPITLTGNDPDGDTVTFSVAAQPSNGTLGGTAPDLTYTPDANFNGSDSFTFTVTDGTATSDAATVTISVAAVNDAPSATSQIVDTNEDAAVSVMLSGTDPDGNGTISGYNVATQPSNGTLSGTAPNLTYTPDANFSGSDSFTFTVTDGTAMSPAATVTISVAALNDAPSATSQMVNTNEDAAVSVTLSGSDPDGNETISGHNVVTGPANGALSGSAPNLTYTPNANFNGIDSFTFTVIDEAATSDAATVTINVAPINDAPVLSPIGDRAVAEGSAVAFTASATDVDGETVTYSASGLPAGASFDTSTGAFSWTPGSEDAGTIQLTITASDPNGASDSEAISITVTNVDRTPIATSLSLATDEDAPLAIRLEGSDPEAAPIFFRVVTQPVHGVVLCTAANCSYTPERDFFGSDSFTYLVFTSDGRTSDSATVSIIVNSVNDAPKTGDLLRTVPANTSSQLELRGSDADGDTLTWTIDSRPEHGTLTCDGAVCSYRPEAGFEGEDSS